MSNLSGGSVAEVNYVTSVAAVSHTWDREGPLLKERKR